MKTKNKFFICFLALQVLQIIVSSSIQAQTSNESNISSKTIISAEKFKGLCYSPYRDNENPDYNVQPSIEEIIEDLSLVKNLTVAIRTYGTTDNMEQVPVICQQNNIDCFPGAWISKYDCENERQTDSLISIAKLKLSHVKGLNVGCETLLRNDVTEQQLIGYINKVKSQTNLPISTSEIWNTWLEHPKLAEAVDIIYVHIYPFWDGIPIENAANYLLDKWNEIKRKYPNKTVVIGETGWPSAGKNRWNAVPNSINQKKYLADFISVASQNNIDYFIFEIFDEKWKIESDLEIGEHWGMYNSNGSPKQSLTELLPEQARAGLSRAIRVIPSKKTILPLYVYSDRCDARNGFYPSGWMGELATIFQDDSTYKDAKQIIDESCIDNPHSGNSCMRISYKPSSGKWGGIYWQFPINNWGNYPGYTFDKVTKVKLSFWARGKNGNEIGEFKTGGIYDIKFAYFDSYKTKTTGNVKLGTTWKQYSFDLSGQDLSMVIGGFCWVTNDLQNPTGCTIYLDDIVFENTKADQTITFGTLPNKTFGNLPFDLTGTSNSGLLITYASSNTNVATISGNKLTIIGTGTTDITASQNGDTNYNAANSIKQTLTVNKADQTITFGTLPNKSFGDLPFDLTASSNSGLPLIYASSNPNVATIAGKTVTIIGAGSTDITASQTGNVNYNTATSIKQTLIVNKAGQTITFGTLQNKTFGDLPFDLTASSNSGLLITYASSNTNVATVSGNKVTIIGTGTTDITASQTGNVNYNTATSIKQTLIVNKADQTITFGTLQNKTVGDLPFDLTASSNSGLLITYASSNTNVATISGNKLTIVGTGTTDITALQTGNVNYNAATSIKQTLIVNKADQTITFGTLPNKTFGDLPFDLTASSNSGLPLTYTSSNPNVATIAGKTVTIIGAGSTDITASQTGNVNYNTATSIKQILIVNKADQTITFGTLQTKTFGNLPFDLVGSSNSGLPLTYTSSNPNVATIAGKTVTIIGTGSSDITASQAGNTNYNAATSVKQILTVNKADQTITFGTLPNKTFGNLPFDLIASSNSGLPLSYTSSNPNVATIAGKTVTIIGTGSSDITASQAGNTNYNAATSVKQILTVNKADQTITFGTLPNKTFGNSLFDLSATSNSGLLITYASSNLNVATISGNKVTIIGTGTTDITASQTGDTNYNAATSIKQPLTVNKADQTITFGTLQNRTFGNLPFDLIGSSNSGLPLIYASSNPNVATIAGSTVTIIGAGSTDITASQAGNTNYNEATSVKQILTVNKADQTITFKTLQNKTLGNLPFDLIGNSTSGLPLTYASSNPNVATVSGNKVTIIGLGTTDITASQTGDTNYNAATSKKQTLIVNKADQTITFGTLPNKTFGDLPFDLTASSNSGLPISYESSNLNVAIISGNKVTIIGKGNADITASQAGNENYNAATSVKQTLIVTTDVVDIMQNKNIIYPNPTSNFLFTNTKEDLVIISIYDTNGKMVLNKKFNDNQIDIRSLKDGFYTIKIKDKSGVVIKKFIKQ